MGRRRDGLITLVLAAGSVLLLLPTQWYWPGRPPYLEVSGTLDAQPVSVPLSITSAEGDAIDVRIQFQMTPGGVFRAAYPEMGPRSYLVGGESGDHRLKLPSSQTLLLDPMGSRGEYELAIGNPYHPFGPTRRWPAYSLLP